MKGPMRARAEAAWLGMALCLGATATAAAQEQKAWTYSVTPYFWMAGLQGQVGIRDLTADVDESFSDIFDNLKFGAMAYVEARYRPWTFGLDAFYVSLKETHAVARTLVSGEIVATQKELMLQPTVGYTIVADSGVSLDVVAGARYWNMNMGFEVNPTNFPGVSRSRTIDWADATIGARIRWTPAKLWRVNLYGDGGGGGSDGTFQALGTVGYDAWSWGTVVAGYRFLYADYNRDDVLFDVQMNGPLLAVAFRF